MIIREMEIDKIKGAEYNPRLDLVPGMPEFERLKNSIEAFDEVIPLVWNQRTETLVSGHQRLSILKHLGYSTVMVSVVDIDLAEEKLLNVALNKIGGQWDYQKLEELLNEYRFEEAAITGFSPQELALLLANDELEGDIDEALSTLEPELGFDGASWVVSLVFTNVLAANIWLENLGVPPVGNSKVRSKVVRMAS